MQPLSYRITCGASPGEFVASHIGTTVRMSFQGSPFGFGDLPTHLPNSVPVVTLEPVAPAPEAPTPAPPSPPTEELTDTAVPSSPHSGDETKVFIPGTSITLETEEDIARWIAERKRRWPTQKNIDAKKQAHRASDGPSGLAKRASDGPSGPAKRAHTARVCQFFQQNKKCRFGAKCKNLHEAPAAAPPTSAASVVKTIRGIAVNIPQRFKSEFYNSDPTLGAFSRMLVQKEQFDENDKILGFLKFLDARGMVDHG